MNISRGKYWDEKVVLVDGCTPCSPGCDHCGSARMAHQLKKGIRDDTRGFFIRLRLRRNLTV
jgi:protein gp37